MAVRKILRIEINIHEKELCVKLVIYKGYNDMHGQHYTKSYNEMHRQYFIKSGIPCSPLNKILAFCW